jgi:hypothetical protein
VARVERIELHGREALGDARACGGERLLAVVEIDQQAEPDPFA